MKTKELLEQREEFGDVIYEKLRHELKKKIYGLPPFPAYKITITWKDYQKNEPDEGYLFSLPECNLNENDHDLFYHVLTPQGYGDKNNPDPEFGYLMALICNDKVKEIEIT